MYQVITMKGEYEPWWFFDNWELLIERNESFPKFEQALQVYEEQLAVLSKKYPNRKTKEPYLTAFWTKEEATYCESCADDLQIYHGLILLKDNKRIS